MKIIPFPDFIRRYHSGEGFVLFDTETTGLNTYHDDIIEVAGALWQKGTEPRFFQEVMKINPNRISGGAQEIHQIPREEIESAREPVQVFSDFLRFCDGRGLAAHNIKFDFDILNSNLIRNGLKPYSNDETACSLVYSKEQSLPGKLEDLALHYRITPEKTNLHRALYDVKLLMEVMNSMMKEHEPKEMQYSIIF